MISLFCLMTYGTPIGKFPSLTWNALLIFFQSLQKYKYITIVLSASTCCPFSSLLGLEQEHVWEMAVVYDAQPWQLYVKDLVGTTRTVSVHNPQVSCDYTSRSMYLPIFLTLHVSL